MEIADQIFGKRLQGSDQMETKLRENAGQRLEGNFPLAGAWPVNVFGLKAFVS